MHLTIRLLILVLCVGWFLTVETVHAAIIVTLHEKTTDAANGAKHYEYTLNNMLSSDYDVAGFDLKVPPIADLSSITAPPNWHSLYYSGDSFASWAPDSNDAQFLPGESGVFSFESRLPPALQDFTITGVDDASGATASYVDGTITGPGSTTVPLPIAAKSALPALIVLIFYFRRLKRYSIEGIVHT